MASRHLTYGARIAAIIWLSFSALTGCGTVNALNTLSQTTPLVYGGTQLDIAAIQDDERTLAKFHNGPPKFPAADLPLSILADTLFLPGTVMVAAFRAAFW